MKNIVVDLNVLARNMKKILVTGGAGFIGSHLTDKLMSRGDTVHVFDNLTTGTKENVE